MELAIIMCWAIWTIRNECIFQGISPLVTRVKEVFDKECRILSLRLKAKFTAAFDSWIQSLL